MQDNQLGVAKLEITRSDEAGDRFLEIVGLDQAGTEIGRAELRIGTVVYSPEPELLAPSPQPGSELTLTVGSATSTFLSPDREAHNELVADATLAAFVRIAPVARAIDKEIGITFDWPKRPYIASESAYFGSIICDSRHFQSGLSVPRCTWEYYSVGYGGWSYFQVPAGLPNAGHLGLRGLYYACTTASGGHACSGTGCWYGPCGGHGYNAGDPSTSEQVYTWNDGSTWHSGADSNGSAAGGVKEDPVPYPNLPQYQYGWNLTGGCTCTDCSNGVPTPAGCTYKD